MSKDNSDIFKSNEMLRLAIEAVQFGIWDWNLKSGELVWDNYMYTLYEIDKNDFSGVYDAFEKTLYPIDAERVKKELESVFKKQDPSFKSEFRVSTKAGKLKHISAAATCFYDSSGAIARLVGCNWDISEQKQSELSLIQSSKMASLGQMASGIAHEINNPLAIISSKAEYLLRNIDSGQLSSDRIKAQLTDIFNTTHRIAKIIKGLRTFSRDSTQDPPEKTQLKAVVLDTVELCKERLKGHDIDLQIDVPEEIYLKARPTQISQVLLNLLNNAHDAIFSLDERWIKVQAHLDQKLIVNITVTDSGNGISKEVAQQIMEPFFSTKEVGAGTGLGLSISCGLIEGHGGRLYYNSDSPKTQFVIELPLGS